MRLTLLCLALLAAAASAAPRPNIVVVLAVACIIKIRQERHENHMYRAHRNSEEMEDVLQNEGSLGRSTPPHDYSSNGGDEFTFKSVKS